MKALCRGIDLIPNPRTIRVSPVSAKRTYLFSEAVNYIITDAHLLLEILDVDDKFCITLMQMTKTTKYMDCLCQILNEENISYKIHGVFNNHLPISKVESAPSAAQQK